MRRIEILAACFFCVISPGAVAQSTGQRLLEQFVNPHEMLQQKDCANIPLFERLKYRPCQFSYLGEMREYVAQKAVARQERMEMEKSRAWIWFNAPPSVGNCNTVPLREKAKFEFQCAPRQTSDGGLGLREVQLAQLQSQREALSARIALLRSDYQRISARAAREAPTISSDVAALEEILAKLDRVDRRAALLRRFAVETQRSQKMDLGRQSRVVIETVPPGLDLRLGADVAAPIAGKTPANGDVVVVLGEAPGNPAALILVHTDLGVVFANKSEFYAR